MSRPNVAVVVAHPDDETLWAGGAILLHPEWRCRIVTLCRRSDPDRSPRFERAARLLGAVGWEMADLDDGPDQLPLDSLQIERALLSLLPDTAYDIVITHSPRGEYTRHRRHEEVSRAVVALLAGRTLTARETWLFAYDDTGGARLPQAIPTAPLQLRLDDDLFARKRSIIQDTYGFAPDSWEARAAPRCEAFWSFASIDEALGAFLFMEARS